MPTRSRKAFLHRQNVANFRAHLAVEPDPAQRKVIETLLVDELNSEAERLKRVRQDGI